ncbi:MAG TPA: HPF/RaiA family ribosome-associated protein [Burkholderiaceae bacterium]|nr:HPF/RaiA family ribosome-associated protein [Burkholderiaceae bacterium]
MEVVVQAHHPDAQALRDEATRRIRFATQRLASFVVRVVVRLKDLNGPRGGVDKVCQVQLNTANGGVMVVSSRGVSWRAALELALARAARALWRRFNERKTKVAVKQHVLPSKT